MAGPSLQDLNAVAAVAARKSFRAAAGELGISPSSLSHAVAALERQLGVRLFNRTTRSVALTEAGEQFLARVQPALREIEDAVEGVNQFRDSPTGLLLLNASEGGAERILPAVLGFMAAYPDMRVDLATENRMVDIVAEGFDAGLRGAESVPRDMVAVSLGMEEAYAVVASPDYAAEHGLPQTPGDVLNHPCIRVRMSSGGLVRWEFEQRGEGLFIDAPGRLNVGGPRLAIQAAKAGVGLAYVILRSVADDLAAGRLVQALEAWTPPYPGICLYYPRQRLPSAGLAAIVEHVKATRRRVINIALET